MNVTYLCPNCERTVRTEVSEEADVLACPACEDQRPIPSGAIDEGRLERCLICPSTDLFLRKDFPQRLGVGLVVAGIVASSIAWGFRYIYLAFAILFGTALIDVVLYFMVGEALMCYRCQAQYRAVRQQGRRQPFDLETHERHRQIAARTAGQPK